MKVRITKCLIESWWYNDRIDEIFDVKEWDDGGVDHYGPSWEVIDPNIEKHEYTGILKEDCEVLLDIKEAFKAMIDGHTVVDNYGVELKFDFATAKFRYEYEDRHGVVTRLFNDTSDYLYIIKEVSNGNQ